MLEARRSNKREEMKRKEEMKRRIELARARPLLIES
jgi:hypothetical protein